MPLAPVRLAPAAPRLFAGAAAPANFPQEAPAAPAPVPGFAVPTADFSGQQTPSRGTNDRAYAGTLWTRIVADVAAYKASDIRFTSGAVKLTVSGSVERYIPSQREDPELGISQALYHGLLDRLLESEGGRWRKVLEENPLETIDFAAVLQTAGGTMRFRVNTGHAQSGRFAVLRPLADVIPTPDKLGLKPAVVDRITNMVDGVFLCVGTTGSGKSTTIASLLNHMNLVHKYSIITVEDPVEIIFQDRNSEFLQREVGQDTKSFHDGLRAAMREAPKVIFIGEIRDIETAKTALEAAETGHIVFATLHAKRASGTVSRIVEMAPYEGTQEIRSLLARVLRCVIAQTLLPKIGGGRVPVREVMFMNNAIAASIREGNDTEIDNQLMQNRKDDMVGFQQALEEVRGEVEDKHYQMYSEKKAR